MTPPASPKERWGSGVITSMPARRTPTSSAARATSATSALSDLVPDACVVLRAVEVDDRLQGHGFAWLGHRRERETGVLERQHRVEIGNQLPRARAAGRSAAPAVLCCHELADGRPSVAVHLRRTSAYHVEKLPVEEQEPVIVAGNLALDQQPPRQPSRPESCAAKMRVGTNARGRQCPTLSVNRFDDTGIVLAVEELQRGADVVGVETTVLRDRQTRPDQDLVHEGLLECPLHRHDVVEWHPMVPDDHSSAAPAQFDEAARQIGGLRAHLTGSVRPPGQARGAIPIRRHGGLSVSMLAPGVCRADRTHQIEPRRDLASGGARAAESVEQGAQERRAVVGRHWCWRERTRQGKQAGHAA